MSPYRRLTGAIWHEVRLLKPRQVPACDREGRVRLSRSSGPSTAHSRRPDGSAFVHANRQYARRAPDWCFASSANARRLRGYPATNTTGVFASAGWTTVPWASVRAVVVTHRRGMLPCPGIGSAIGTSQVASSVVPQAISNRVCPGNRGPAGFPSPVVRNGEQKKGPGQVQALQRERSVRLPRSELQADIEVVLATIAVERGRDRRALVVLDGRIVEV